MSNGAYSDKSKEKIFVKQVSEGLQTNQGSAPRFLLFSDESVGCNSEDSLHDEHGFSPDSVDKE